MVALAHMLAFDEHMELGAFGEESLERFSLRLNTIAAPGEPPMDVTAIAIPLEPTREAPSLGGRVNP